MSFTALVAHSIFPTAFTSRCSHIANTMSNRFATTSRGYFQVREYSVDRGDVPPSVEALFYVGMAHAAWGEDLAEDRNEYFAENDFSAAPQAC